MNLIKQMPPQRRGGVTFGIGALGGLAFFALSLPLPWVLGSLTASLLCTQTTSFQPRFPAPWRSYAMVAIGTMLGTSFTPEVVRQAGDWTISLIVMSLLSLAFCFIAYQIFYRFGKMDRVTALFAAIPGGLSVVSVLAENYRAEVSRVALCHTARLVVLLIAAPIIIQAISGINLADASLASFTHAEAIDPVNHGILALVAIVSGWLAWRLNFPSAMLLIPLLSSGLLHATDLLTVHVPPLLSSAAQIVIGAGVGARFANYSLPQILKDGWLAAVIGVLLTFGSFIAALLFAPIIGLDNTPLFLSYLPGGAPELGVVALALSIDPAMVAAHHVLRVFLIVAMLPLIASWLGKQTQRG
ncbi:AbrB family transcriptional regulator [Halomonas sp. AOP43-A1-21]|uniref:AbrB family transcriptional regulator n=2 Tax=Halomonas TaxID=2745 RepID=UPI0029C9C65E|nr:AbrB family transcriptional regulator [Halomonas colorata]